MNAAETLFKVLGKDRQPVNGGSGQWPPIGAWTEPITGELRPRVHAYHLARGAQLLNWLRGEGLLLADKLAVRRARLTALVGAYTPEIARRFAADCAEHVLPLYERRHPGDGRPRQAIEAARAFVRGEITREQLEAARGGARKREREWQLSRLLHYLRGEVPA